MEAGAANQELLGGGGIRNRICLAIHRYCALIPDASAVVTCVVVWAADGRRTTCRRRPPTV
jgi:hypothetical protein